MDKPIKSLVAATLIVSILFIVFFVQCRIDGVKGDFKQSEELEMLPPAYVIKTISMNQTAFISDILWLRVVQYMGDKKQTEKGWSWFSHTIDIITDLDPEFTLAYQFAGLMFTVVAGKSEESLKILEKGIKNTSNNWFLYFLIGYNYFELQHDYGKAAYYIDRASTLPGAPVFLKLFASRLYSSAGKPENGIIFVKKLLETTEDEDMKTKLDERLKLLYIERDLGILNNLISDFHSTYKKYPESIDDLLKAGLIRGIPSDPFGKPYYIDMSDNTAKSQSTTERLKVFKR